MPDSAVIETLGLRKIYDGVEALADLSLRVPRGSIYGLLGRNGAGKTTTIKVLLGMVRPTSGQATVFGLPVADGKASVEIRRRAALVSEDRDIYENMSVEQIVGFAARFYPHWRSDLQEGYVRRFGLPAERRVTDLSRGMRTQLALSIALSSGTELLILDEPTSGLDPEATEETLQALVAHAAREEATVFLSTHQLADVDQIADRIAIADRGRILIEAPLDDLRERYRRVRFVFADEAPMPAFRTAGIVATRRQGRELTVLSSTGTDQVVAEGRALNPESVEVLPVTLKEIFLETVAAEN